MLLIVLHLCNPLLNTDANQGAPKSALFDEDDSDEEPIGDDFQGEDSSDEDDDEEEMDIEKKSKKLKAQKSEEDQLAEEELQMNIQRAEKFTLPSGEEVEKETLLPPDLTVLKSRIKEVVSHPKT